MREPESGNKRLDIPFAGPFMLISGIVFAVLAVGSCVHEFFAANLWLEGGMIFLFCSLFWGGMVVFGCRHNVQHKYDSIIRVVSGFGGLVLILIYVVGKICADYSRMKLLNELLLDLWTAGAFIWMGIMHLYRARLHTN
ncbi:MAG: hypothetical protein GY832_09265 [Chloroflexi bacterium]|nr:hypothetical protein [Chloroflexota bacterium]